MGNEGGGEDDEIRSEEEKEAFSELICQAIWETADDGSHSKGRPRQTNNPRLVSSDILQAPARIATLSASQRYRRTDQQTHVSTIHNHADPTAHAHHPSLPIFAPSQLKNPMTGLIHTKIKPR